MGILQHILYIKHPWVLWLKVLIFLLYSSQDYINRNGNTNILLCLSSVLSVHGNERTNGFVSHWEKASPQQYDLLMWIFCVRIFLIIVCSKEAAMVDVFSGFAGHQREILRRKHEMLFVPWGTYADGFILQKGRWCRYCLALRTYQECVEYILYQYLASRWNIGIWNMKSIGDVNGLGEKDFFKSVWGSSL